MFATRRVRNAAAALAIIASCIAAGFVTSRVYWGYWYEPPNLDVIPKVRRIDSFGAVWPANTFGTQPKAGVEAFRVAAQYGNQEDPSFPLGRIPAQLASRGLSPQTSDPSATRFFGQALRILRQRHLLVAGEPGYASAQHFDSAYLALVRTDDQTPVLLFATHGGQVSNDHYPYYEGAFRVTAAGELEPLQIHRFFFDVAGLEGATAFGFAIAAGVILVPVGMVAYGILLGLKLRRGVPSGAGQRLI